MVYFLYKYFATKVVKICFKYLFAFVKNPNIYEILLFRLNQ